MASDRRSALLAGMSAGLIFVAVLGLLVTTLLIVSALRRTEARLDRRSDELLQQIEKRDQLLEHWASEESRTLEEMRKQLERIADVERRLDTSPDPLKRREKSEN